MTASPDALRERAHLWLEPISSQAPCGSASKHHPTYEAVTAEIAKLESPTGDAVRWDEVVRGAGELLRGTSKDLWLASYFAYGLYATEGLAGALTGTVLLTELTERYWQGLFPEASRLRSRGLALAWFVERMTRMLPATQTPPPSPEVVESLAAAVSRLAEVTRARLASQAPALGPLITSIERLRVTPPPPTPAMEPPPPAPAPAPSVTAEAPPPPSAPPAPAAAPPPPAPLALATALPAPPQDTPTSAEAVTDFLRNVGTSLASTAALLRQAQPTNPLAYRLLRTGLWLHLSHPPAVGAQGKTALPSLPAPLRTKLETLTTHTRWLELLDEAESAMVPYRFALDLQRFSASALSALGATHAAAREALTLELSSLLKRMPEVMELLAADGTPLADKTTKEWLRREVMANPAPVPRPAAPPPLALEAEAPLPGLSSEGESETFEVLQRQVAAAPTARARFAARLRLARRCALEGQPAAARALYEVLDAECTARALDAWEPALAAACLEGFLHCARSVKESQNELVGDDWIRYRRLVQLDPAAALRVQP